ncbi:phage terminase large subunit-like protein [Roseiarcus fermentans]|uniref:Phage terminase large subunit-like protein n=1 Tax=Roseiarcus fermentans TaxID=1473586 RepID=A0A366EQN8_9HYPH|nr:terminase large subunit [Roseiarcus fermentans]RBP03819.1 phage terminase large subunit-like protein [Roseiarcus fermentans]
MPPVWTTAIPDWRERLVESRPLIPFAPLFPDEARAASEIFDSLPVIDVAGKPPFGDIGRPWVRDFVNAVFGAYDAATGRRLIQYFFLLIAKKNGKSTLAAGVMVAALIRNWRESGEFYILAPTKEVADNSYTPAADMVREHSVLRSILKPCAGRVIEHRNTGATLKVVAADSETVSGKKTIGLLVDELWLFGKRAASANMLIEAEGGLASRPEGFVIYLSTHADGPPKGVFKDKLDEFRAIRDGKIVDPKKLPVLYEFPEHLIQDDQFKHRRWWSITNPNLGASVDPDFLAGKLAEAQRAGRAQLASFYAKHLNVPIGQGLSADGWAGAELWSRRVEPGLTLDAILDRCELCTVGIDGGGLDDLLGLAVIGRERGTKRWLAWGCALISTIGVGRRKANAADYLAFKREGDLTVFRFDLGVEDLSDDDDDLAELVADALPPETSPEGWTPDVARVVDVVRRINDRGLLAQVGVDAMGIGTIVDALAEIGVTQDEERLFAVRQGIGLMGAFKTVERKLADGSFVHGGGRLLSWCVGNLKLVQTPTAVRLAREESGLGKIDPACALFNAGALMAANPELPDASVYTADRGLIVFE